MVWMPAVVLERSSTTKYVVNGRNTLSLESVKAQKVVLSGIRAAGGAHLVPISANMLNSVKMAHSPKVAVDKEKAEAKRKAEEAAAGEQRKEGQEAEQRTLDEKKRRLEDIIREIQEEIMNEKKKPNGCCEQRFKADGACSGAGSPEDCRGLPKLLMGGSSSY